MYRLMLFYVSFLVATSIILGLTGYLPFNPWHILATGISLVLLCHFLNKLFAYLVGANPNPESSIITALILTLIIGPMPVNSVSNLWFIVFVAMVAMASKYLAAYRKRHIFNPAAFAVVMSALLLDRGASWWVGYPSMVWFVLAGGLIMTYKIKRWHLVISFLAAYFGLLLASTINSGGIQLSFVRDILMFSPILFFSFVMLVEPLTAPQGKKLRICYAIVIAVIFFLFQWYLPQISFGFELSLLAANLGFRAVADNPRLVLRLRERRKVAANTEMFVFESEKQLIFKAGQFLEWTLAHPHPDSRGIRRYFTIASSPTEPEIILVTKFAPQSSSFKKALQVFKPGDEVVVSNREGEFTMPSKTGQSLVFIAGGIGITPFRSMIKYLLDTNLKDFKISLLYSNKTEQDIAFRDLFDEARRRLGIKIVYTLTENTSDQWPGRKGFIDEVMIKEEITDWRSAIFYVSGPEPMVKTFEKMLAGMGVRRRYIKRDYFPGYE